MTNPEFFTSKVTVTFDVAATSKHQCDSRTLWTEIGKVLDQQNFIYKNLLVNVEGKND